MKSAYKKIKSIERQYTNRFNENFKMINGWINLKSYGGANYAYTRRDLVREISSALQWGENKSYLFEHFEILREYYEAPNHYACRNNNNLACSASMIIDEDLPF